MSIIISKAGRGAQKIERTVIEQEDYLQQYIYNNPEALPFHELKDDLRLLILAREFNTASGPVDAIGADADGEIYVIETKLYKNADKRRVIAQMLDYGAAIWSNPDQFLARANETEWRNRLLEFLGGDEGLVAEQLANVQQNAKAGRFWFVVLMDKLDERLKELISFVNANSCFKVLGVELDFYRHEGFEIIIPNLYGAERASKTPVSRDGRGSGKSIWDEAAFLARIENQLTLESADHVRELFAVTRESGVSVGGTGQWPAALFAPFLRPIFWVTPQGKVMLNFKELNNLGEVGTALVTRLAESLEGAGFLNPASGSAKYPTIPIGIWSPRPHEFVQIIRRALGS